MNGIDIVEKDGELEAVVTSSYQKYLDEASFKVNLKKSGIPSDYWDLDFRHASVGTNKDVVSKCRMYYSDIWESGKKYSLYLYGKQTSGKTTTACAIGKQWLMKGKKVQFILAGDLIDLLMKTQGYNYHPDLEKIKKIYFDSDLLIIDDAFDKNKSMLWESESRSLILAEWDRFLRRALASGVRIVATSNIPFDEVEGYYKKSIAEIIDRNFSFFAFTEVDMIRKTRKRTIQEESIIPQ